MDEQLRSVYAHFLTADLNTCGTGCLPADLPARHASVLQGRFVLQVDEAVDTAAPAKLRHARGHTGFAVLQLVYAHANIQACMQV